MKRRTTSAPTLELEDTHIETDQVMYRHKWYSLDDMTGRILKNSGNMLP